MSRLAQPASLQNSTNVRTGSAGFALVSLLSSVAPAVASRIAERALFVPPRRRASNVGQAFLRTGIHDEVRLGRLRLATWRWTPDRFDPASTVTVAFVHGWGGAASQFRSLVSAIVASGRTAVAFDAPGHGQSSGRRSSIVAIRDGLLAVAGRVDAPVSLVAHSGGAAAATLAMTEGLSVHRAVFIGPTIDPAGWIAEWAQAAGLSPAVLARVRARTERDLGIEWSTLRILPRAVERSQPLLVIHDRDDKEVPWTDGADLADTWPRARLLLTRGLGHRRILHDPVVADAVADFFASKSSTPNLPAFARE